MGHLNGVATQIRKEEPRAISVHCLAHCLNLCLQDVAKNASPVRNALDVVLEISKLIQYSPKRTVIFQQCKQDLSLTGTGLRPLCPRDGQLELKPSMRSCSIIQHLWNH